jgi:hypothetical protein
MSASSGAGAYLSTMSSILNLDCIDGAVGSGGALAGTATTALHVRVRRHAGERSSIIITTIIITSYFVKRLR